MDYNTVVSLLDEICFNFNKSRIADKGRLEHFARKLAYVKDDAYDSIAKHFEGLSSFPGNLLLEIQTAYCLWLEKQPLDYSRTRCRTCKNTGLLYREEYDPGDCQTYMYAARCPACHNWKPHTGAATPFAKLDKYNYKPYGSGSNPAHMSDSRREECKTCNDTGYLRSLEELGSKSIETKLSPVTWTCPFCENWFIGNWDISERKDPPDAQTLDRCIPSDEDFDAEYKNIINGIFAKARQRKRGAG